MYRRSSDSPRKNGVVFTPPAWAHWVIARYQLLAKWRAGAILLDPTAGTGNFLGSLIRSAQQADVTITPEMLARLYGIEKNRDYVAQFLASIHDEFGLHFPRANFLQDDFLFSRRAIKADILLGNPPWQNFTCLPDDYKERTKPLFVKYGLVGNQRSILLGNSRVDIAALIISKALCENLSPGGEAYFFIPLSLLLNDGAHACFRSYNTCGIPFCIHEVFDFKNEDAFGRIGTRHGLAAFRRDRQQSFPITYFVRGPGDSWEARRAWPLALANDPLLVSAGNGLPPDEGGWPRITVDKTALPRQGINTCGANAAFFFDSLRDLDGETVEVENPRSGPVHLPRELLYPLISNDNFKNGPGKAHKYVFLPYDAGSGRPLPQAALAERSPLAWRYLLSLQSRLEQRKGVLINAWIKKGCWWALLGVGPYSFAPYKVVWQAYGKRCFAPRLFGSIPLGLWQANQALQAYMPFADEAEAVRVLEALRAPLIEELLRRQQMEGTCNWAQPGRIRKFLEPCDLPD